MDPVVMVEDNQNNNIQDDAELRKQKQSYVTYMIVVALVIAIATIGVFSYPLISSLISSSKQIGKESDTPPFQDVGEFLKLKMKKYPHGSTIKFKSFLNEENTVSQNEMSFGFLLTSENNLGLSRAKLLALTNSVKRQLPTGEEIVEEPKRQFIVKLKTKSVSKVSIMHVLEANLEINQEENSLNKDVVKFNNILAPGVVSIVAKASELLQHIGEDNAIEWIGEYENRFKSSLNFKKIQQTAVDMKRNPPKVDKVKRSVFNITQLNSKEAPFGLDPNMVEVVISLVPSLEAIRAGKEMEEAENFANQINKILAETYVTDIEYKPMKVFDENKCGLSFSPLIASRVGDLLMENQNVHFIERKLFLSLQNKYSQKIMQNIDPSVTSPDQPFYALGILGNNQIVAVADTGLDYDNCFFSDSARPMTFDTMNSLRRKVVYYKTSYADNNDRFDGHGTHVCGSVAGSIENVDINTGLNQYHGVAPAAKIFFTDLEKSSNPGALMIPEPISTLYSVPYSMGARIFTNSFGCGPDSLVDCAYNCQSCKLRISMQGYQAGASVTDSDCKNIFGVPCCEACNVYNSQCQDTDKFLWNNRDAIILFSQGNSGRISEFGNTGYPAVSKNTLTVGAHHTTNAGFVDGVNYEDYLHKMQEAGLPWTSTADCCAYSGYNKDEVRDYCCPATAKTSYSSKPTVYNENNLASFSSRGPAMGGRIKPDIVAVGQTVISMHSDGSSTSKNCGTQSPQLNNNAALYLLSGTSMATPLTAGGVALVRQFFQKTYSVTNPSGSLLKAAIINSASPLTGTVAYSDDENNRFNIQQKYGSPNFYDGFGKVQLGGLLRDKYNNPVSLIFAENTFSAQSESARLCLRLKKTVTAKSAFRATLAWYDYPGSTAVQGGLVHDLDVYANTYVQSLSTGATSNLNIILANGKTDIGDSENNVERVEIDPITNPTNADSAFMISIQIMNFGLVSGTTQPFSFVSSVANGFWEQLSPSSCVYKTSYDGTARSQQSVNVERAVNASDVLPPKNIQITRVTPDTIQLNWEKPNEMDLDFHVMYDSTVLNTKDTTISITGLKPGISYNLNIFSSIENVLSTKVSMTVSTLSPRTVTATSGQSITLRSSMVFNFEVPQGGKMLVDMPDTFKLEETTSRGLVDSTFNVLDLGTGNYLQLDHVEKNFTDGSIQVIFGQAVPVTECVFTIKAITTAIRDLDNFANIYTYGIDGTQIEFNTLPLPKLINPENPNPHNDSFIPLPVAPNPIIPSFSYITNNTGDTIRGLSISTGILAGVTVLAVISALVIGVVLIWFVCKNKRKTIQQATPSAMVSEEDPSVYYRKDQRLD